MNPIRSRLILALLGVLCFLGPRIATAWQGEVKQALHNGAILVEDDAGQVLLEHRSREFFVPASTIKVATAACALQNMGSTYRFPTDFYLTPEQILYVKGYGDPFLVSEELALIVRELKQKGLTTVKGIRLDNTFFEPDVSVDGAANSINPYDALNGALIANFNTVHYIKDKQGIRTAEAQTPLTPLGREVAAKNPSGTERVNIGKDPVKGARYVGELLAALMTQADIPVEGTIELEAVPSNLPLYHRHVSSKSQEELLRGMLDFSTNFIANQLFLVMGAQAEGAPATVEKAQRALSRCLETRVGWQDFTVVEGAGLSRHNQVSARQMMALLRQFQEHRTLLPLEKKYFRAKTGTLRGVNTLIGYFDLDDGRLVRFVILVNDTVPFNNRYKIAQQIRNHLNTPNP